ncbi:DUF6314 family protein [Streptomyces rimosus]|uniref:DUF6314 family protein n=1 Tax=Streptomyces rimosus TaxID=1927 RepID=UPI0004C4D20C|nr:DUF6314 family protein [Streptomyces rimosus]
MSTEHDGTPAPGGRYPAPDAAAYLAGWWTIDRTVADVRTGTQGTFHGTAHYHPENPGAGTAPVPLRHIEEGHLTWNGTTTPATRTLRLHPRPDGTAAITFADGRPFHDLDLRTGHWTTRHPCAADLYEGEFTVVSEGEWHLTWRVGGPAKEQLLRSVYRRTDRPSA